MNNNEVSGPLKIAIVGGTGRVGSQLIPRLQLRNCEILVVSRDPRKAERELKNVEACHPSQIPTKAADYDAILHLSVLNTDKAGSYEQFYNTNVTYQESTYRLASEARIPLFISFSSVLALDLSNQTHYAVTKRLAADRLLSFESGITRTKVLYLPLVYGQNFTGRLAVLNFLPHILRRQLRPVISCLKPAISVESLVDYITDRRRLFSQDSSLVLVDPQEGNRLYKHLSRAIDLLICTVTVLMFWWLLFAICLVIRLESPGPALFTQTRVGRFGRPFRLYKFRTMHVGTRTCATHEVSAASLTRVGAILRRLKLDELPQVINVFLNQMSIVGPRPSLPSQAQLIQARATRGVLDVKPGITGLAQIRGVDMSDHTRLADLDAHYVATQSLLGDASIAIKTVLGRGQGDRVRKAA